ncbi:hypothetical protein GJ744_010045 [Endocarpon pusillum]|uniref:Uncharacterized protein n=1 Tax=Endocarpon pusillum TaxID=364733 RepID=A0A8H7E5U1_9EURO|nr:hypothetical protein GJ744_010045 [Endocarpon pusillum]
MIRHLQKTGRSLELTCFFEELPLLAVGEVVSKDSATFSGYNIMSIYASHRDMVKFGNADENGFKRVVRELIRWERHLRLQASTLFDDSHAIYAVATRVLAYLLDLIFMTSGSSM